MPLLSTLLRAARTCLYHWPRRLGAPLCAALLTIGLSGCLVSEELVDLGPRAQPLEAGLYVSFEKDGSPDHAVVMRKTPDGLYDSEDFEVALYESGIAPEVYFMAYVDENEDVALYGVAVVEADALSYPGVVCKMVPQEARDAAKMAEHKDGCRIDSAEQGRAVLTALWRALPNGRDGRNPSWTRFVRQTDFRR